MGWLISRFVEWLHVVAVNRALAYQRSQQKKGRRP